jgi:hypothetical protein
MSAFSAAHFDAVELLSASQSWRSRNSGYALIVVNNGRFALARKPTLELE